MATVKKTSSIKTWKKIKDNVYGKKGTPRRDTLESDAKSFSIGLQLRNAREQKKLTQDELGNLINKK